MEHTYLADGTDITQTHAKYYMRLKKLLKKRGCDPSAVDSCDGLAELRILGIRVGILGTGPDIAADIEHQEDPDKPDEPVQRTLSAAEKLKQHRAPPKELPLLVLLISTVLALKSNCV